MTGTGAVQTTTGSYNFVEYNTRRTVTKNKDGSYTVNVDNSETNISDSGTGVVSVAGSTKANWVYGGYSYNGSADGNTIELTNAVVTNRVYGGYTNNGSSANGNKVTLKDSYVGAGTYSDLNNVNVGVMGGFAAQGAASNNEVSITGGQVANVTAGRSNGNGVVDHNTLTLSGTVVEGYAVAGRAYAADATNNTVTATNTKATGITGGRVGTTDVDGYKADNNHVKITGGNVQYVTGGDANRGDATNNDVTLNGVTVNMVRGGRSRTVGDATGNKVTLENGATANSVCGGEVNNYGDATGNIVTLTGTGAVETTTGSYNFVEYNTRRTVTKNEDGSYTVNVDNSETNIGDSGTGVVSAAGSTTANWVYGGFSNNGSADSNTIELTNAVVTNRVYGGYTNNGSSANGNKVTLTDSYVGAGTYSDLNNVNVGVMGGFAAQGAASNNEVSISGGQVANVTAGRSNGNGVVDHNTLTLSGTVVEGYAVAGRANAADATNNTVTATNTKATGITGGRVGTTDVDGFKADNNHVKITGGTVQYVTGGDANRGAATNNDVTLNGVTVNMVRGGRSRTVGDATGNTVTLENGATATNVFGGEVNNYGNATGNIVNINGSTVTGSVSGGYSKYGTVHDNTINIVDGTVTAVNVGNSYNGSGYDNTVNISGASHVTNVYGADGRDYINVSGTSQVANIYGNGGDDEITISGGTIGLVNGGAGSDHYNITWTAGGNLVIDNRDYAESDVDIFKISNKNSTDFSFAYDSENKELTLTDADDSNGQITVQLTNDLLTSANFKGITFADGETLSAQQIYNKVNSINNTYTIIAPRGTNESGTATSVNISADVLGAATQLVITPVKDEITDGSSYALDDGGNLIIRYWTIPGGGADELTHKIIIKNFASTKLESVLTTDSATGNTRTSYLVKEDMEVAAIGGGSWYYFTGKDNDLVVDSASGATTLDFSGYRATTRTRMEAAKGEDGTSLVLKFCINEYSAETGRNEPAIYNTVTLKNYFNAEGNVSEQYANVTLRLYDHYQNTDIRGVLTYMTDEAETITVNQDEANVDGQKFLYANGGADQITVSTNRNYINAGADNDTITVTGNRNIIEGGAGVDTIIVGEMATDGSVSGNNNYIHGGDGDDNITVQSSKNYVMGGDGADEITLAYGFNNILNGWDGDDYIRVQGGTGHDLSGGEGSDTYRVDEALTKDVFITIGQESEPAETDADVLQLKAVVKADAKFDYYETYTTKATSETEEETIVTYNNVLLITDSNAANGGNVLVYNWNSSLSSISFSDGSSLSYDELNAAFTDSEKAALSFTDSTGATGESLQYTLTSDDNSKVLTFSK